MAGKIAERATIYNVAKEAGVSITTVSRFLNNSDNVKTSTGVRIAEAMERLDYVSQGNAGSRVHRNVGRVGVLTPFFPAPSFVQRLEGMIPVFRHNNFEVVVYTIENSEQLDEYLNSVPFTRRIDGLILMSVLLSPRQRRILQASGLHVVMVETDDENFSRVLADNYEGGRIAARLFLEKDYFPCVYVGDWNRNLSYSLHPSDMRLKGFREALIAGGRKLEERMIIKSDTTVESARGEVGKLLDRSEKPRAIFAMSDLQAIGTMKAANDRGMRVPDDLAVLGFDDIEPADWLRLSSITQHLADSGRIASNLLVDQISGKSKAIQKINLQVGLIERHTT
ncbi:MAG: LacI family DNA-binding transcriptional regulator [Spirochaetales bacterium]|jgi:LacI family transcriptional regulator|nr:LacI family DNA-binding transcriptional regulator [Spirochaetales bacterium]